jgi:glucose uptake protein GlcU
MKKTISKYYGKIAFAQFTFLGLLYASPAFAQTQDLQNPIQSDNIEELLVNLTRYILGIIAVVAVVMIVIAGARMIISGSNENESKNARKMITNALMGLIVAMLAFTIVSIIQNVIKNQ